MSKDPDAILDAEIGATGAALRAARAMIESEARHVAPDHVLEASVKWGQPSFALSPKRGTAIRVGVHAGRPALFVHCGTSLVEDWRARMGVDADVEGARVVFIDPSDVEALRPFVRAALNYRMRT